MKNKEAMQTVVNSANVKRLDALYNKYKEVVRSAENDATCYSLRVGKILAEVRDSQLWRDGGYTSLSNCGKELFGITAATVTNAVKVWDKYGKSLLTDNETLAAGASVYPYKLLIFTAKNEDLESEAFSAYDSGKSVNSIIDDLSKKTAKAIEQKAKADKAKAEEDKKNAEAVKEAAERKAVQDDASGKLRSALNKDAKAAKEFDDETHTAYNLNYKHITPDDYKLIKSALDHNITVILSNDGEITDTLDSLGRMKVWIERHPNEIERAIADNRKDIEEKAERGKEA